MADKNPMRTFMDKGNFFKDVLNYIRLIVRLMGDGRVNPFLKLLPLGSLAYIIWPVDVPGPIDDAAILGLGFYLFIELCPKDVVEEHIKQLRETHKSRGWDATQPSENTEIRAEDIIEAEYREKQD